MRTLNLSNTFIVSDRDGEPCRIEFPPEDYLILYVSPCLGFPASKLDHPNVILQQSFVNSYKHTHPKRGKWWTEKAAVRFYFAFDKKDITLLQNQCGFSFVDIEIGGEKFTLSCSGGTSHDSFRWVDWVTQGGCIIGSNISKKRVQLLANHALCIPECKDRGIVFFPMIKEKDVYGFQRLAARQIVKIKKGMKIYLYGFYKNEGIVLCKSKRHWIVQIDHNIKARIYRKDIDWYKTALENNIDLPEYIYHNALSVDNLFYQEVKE